MRKSLFILALLLAACGGDGSSPTGSGALPLAQHVPQIANLALLPKTAAQMEGGGEMVISIQVTFSDAGKDVQTLWVDVQDGQKVQFDEFSDAATGTLTEQLAVSTKTAGTFAIEVWVVDKAGDASNHLSAQFEVTDGSQGNGWALQWNWTRQLGPLPYVLNDVVWNGTRFVAVGDEGKVLTSSDGTDWVERHSGVDADLEHVAGPRAHDLNRSGKNMPNHTGPALRIDNRTQIVRDDQGRLRSWQNLRAPGNTFHHHGVSGVYGQNRRDLRIKNTDTDGLRRCTKLMTGHGCSP